MTHHFGDFCRTVCQGRTGSCLLQSNKWHWNKSSVHLSTQCSAASKAGLLCPCCVFVGVTVPVRVVVVAFLHAFPPKHLISHASPCLALVSSTLVLHCFPFHYFPHNSFLAPASLPCITSVRLCKRRRSLGCAYLDATMASFGERPSVAPLRKASRIQFGLLSPEEIRGKQPY